MTLANSALRANLWTRAIPFVAVYGVVWGVAGIVLPLVAGSAGRAGLVFAMLNLGIGLAAPLWGYMARRFAVADLIFASTLLAGLSWAALTFLGNSRLPLLAFLFGLFASGTFALATVQVTKTFPKPQWDTHIADMQSLMVIGQVVGLLATSLYSGAALGIPFLFVGTIAAAIMGHGTLRRRLADIEQLAFKLRAVPTVFPGILHGHHILRFHPKDLAHFRTPGVAAILTPWTLLILAWAPVFAVYPLMMSGNFGLSGSVSSLLYSGSTALSIPLFLFAGGMSKHRSPAAVMTIGAVVSTIAFALMYAGPEIGGRFLGAAGFAMMVCSYGFVAVGMNNGVVSLVSEQKQGEILGVANALMSIDNVLGGIFGGALVSAFGYRTLFEIGFIVSLIAVGFGVAKITSRLRVHRLDR